MGVREDAMGEGSKDGKETSPSSAMDVSKDKCFSDAENGLDGK